MRRLTGLACFVLLAGCGNNSTDTSDAGDASAPQDASSPVDATTPVDSQSPQDAAGDAPAPDSGLPPSGWLYTVSGSNKVYVSNGASGTVWMGRGVNMDDIFLCGYNEGFWMSNPDAETVDEGMLSDLMTNWKPTFLRISLSMDSFPPYDISWAANTSQYTTHMTNIIDAIGTHPNVYVLVTLRSDSSMVNGSNQECAHGGDDAVCIPTNNTDAVYQAIVDSFGSKSYVLFGLSNEPGGNAASDSTLSSAMSHAVGVIRAEENKLGVPHHVVSVQGNDWTSSIAFYDSAPLPYDNVVYEYHSYPPSSSGYTMTHIPVIIGEYGPSGTDTSFTTAFYTDVESKQIPNLAWDLDTYNDCAPDLANVTNTQTITASAWGQVVKTYLTAPH